MGTILTVGVIIPLCLLMWVIVMGASQFVLTEFFNIDLVTLIKKLFNKDK